MHGGQTLDFAYYQINLKIWFDCLCEVNITKKLENLHSLFPTRHILGWPPFPLRRWFLYCASIGCPNMVETKNLVAMSRGVLFGLYAAASLYFLIYYSTDQVNRGKCLIKHTYRTEMASSLVSNPMYTATQVWRNPPKTTATGYDYAFDQQKESDVGVFPLVMKDARRVSSFVNVIHIPAEPNVTEWGNSTHYPNPASLDDTSTYPAYSETDLLYGDHAAKEWRGIFQMRKLILGSRLIQNGGSDVNVETTVTKHLFGDEFYGITDQRSLLPNVERCINITNPAQSDPMDKGSFYRELNKYFDYSYYRGICAMNGLHQKVDVVGNYKTNLAPFSSISLHYIPHVVFWVAASFQLISAVLVLGSTAQQWGFIVAIIWNIFGVGVIFVIGAQSAMYVPVNNLVIATVACLSAAAVQLSYLWAPASTAFDFEGWGKGSKAVPQKGMYHPVENPNLRMRAPSRGFVSPMQLSAPWGWEPRTNTTEVVKGHDLTIFENTEYMITAPLVFVYMLIAYGEQYIPTSTLQLTIVAVLGARMACACMLQFHRMDFKKVRTSNIGEAFVLLCMATAFLEFTALYTSYQLTNGLEPMFFKLTWFFEMFFVFFVAVYVLGTWFKGWWENFAEFVSIGPVFMDFIIKCVFFCAVVITIRDKSWTNHGCSMWAYLGKPFDRTY